VRCNPCRVAAYCLDGAIPALASPCVRPRLQRLDSMSLTRETAEAPPPRCDTLCTADAHLQFQPYVYLPSPACLVGPRCLSCSPVRLWGSPVPLQRSPRPALECAPPTAVKFRRHFTGAAREG